MKSEQCQAIVLSTLNYGESDRIVSLLTLEHGRLRGFAKSARASRKRFGGQLEPANRLAVTLSLKEDGLSRIERVEQSSCYPELRERLESLALALYACELVETLTPEGHPLPRLFRLLSTLFEHLAGRAGSAADRRFFEINLLNILGYRPVLDTAALQPLSDCLKTGSFGRVRFTDTELETAGRLLDREIAGHCSRPLNSLAFLEDLAGY
ncbi:DNA repair protein RecO [Trichlorobacter lovleyi]|uniref:DNA repair protein RecO n=1 Tax=Trichlorobacter lovleyi TaxID=313985 RepID=UPI0022409929|nr:DNA repair protein RecO [Trichlorobacter lovleyi]QOX79750.1 DNA repair protein RecO [Trichlorobacter lovleyi]